MQRFFGAIVFCCFAIGANAVELIAIEGATLIDLTRFGRSIEDINNSVILIQDGRVVSVGPRKAIRVPTNATHIDARGKYIVPGLIDVFATQNSQSQANAHLYMGVTAIVGIDGDDRRGKLFNRADPSPQIIKFDSISGFDFSSVPENTPDDLRLQKKIAVRKSSQQLRDEVDQLAKNGVRVLLLHYELEPDQVAVLVKRARFRGLATIGELGSTHYPEAADLGINAFVHTSRYSLDVLPRTLRDEVAAQPFGKPRIEMYQYYLGIDSNDAKLNQLAKIFARAKVGLIPTLAMSYASRELKENPWLEPIAKTLDPDEIHIAVDPITGSISTQARPLYDQFPARSFTHLNELEKAFCKNGNRYLAGSGTDAFGTMPGISLHRELWLLVEACLTPREAIAAATTNVSGLFGFQDQGQIRAGNRADLIILNADPTQDIDHLKNIHAVYLNGQPLDREAMLKLTHHKSHSEAHK